MAITEKQIEAFCVKEASIRGGKALKWSSPSQKGVPDRIIVLPGGLVGFLELKRPGGKPTKLQTHWIKTLQNIGCISGIASTKEEVKDFMDNMQC